MTTTVKVTSHNTPARVSLFDTLNVSDTPVARGMETHILFPEDGEREFHCYVGREIRVTDLDDNDPAVIDAKASKSATLAASVATKVSVVEETKKEIK